MGPPSPCGFRASFLTWHPAPTLRQRPIMAERNVNGIVLAAGASSRMGEPKALLKVEGITFLERAVHLLREAGCKYVIAVVTDDLWIERLADVSGAAVIINDAEDAEQIDSLRLGIANLPDDTDA